MVVAKLFGNPQDAVKALSALKNKGFTEKEIGILALNKREMTKILRGKVPNLLQVNSVVASGPLAAALAGNADLVESLVKALETSVEKAEYYQFRVSTGGVLVTVHADESHARKAHQILREAETVTEPLLVHKSSPGFVAASRMSATNPIDAPMSGDFRKY